MRETIIKAIKKVVGTNEVTLEFPDGFQFGDYTCNVAMILAKERKTNPRSLAEDIVGKLNKVPNLAKIVEKIDVAGPGFINFWLKTDALVSNLIQIEEEKEKYGFSKINNALPAGRQGKLAIVEYSSPNIAKPFTVGHLRSTIIGDAVANLLTATGYKVLRDNHLGDWGTQFGKQIYALKAWGDEDKITKSDNPVKELVALYVKFHNLAEVESQEEAKKDKSLDDAARAWFKKLENGDLEARRLWQKCIDWSFVEFDRIYKTLGIEFSPEFNDGRGLGESFFETRMGAVIKELEKNNLLTVGEAGAKLVFFDGDKYPPLMIIKKDGATLYATRDLATDKYRKEKYDPDLIINEVGSEQALYFRQIYETEKLLGWYKEGQRVHVAHGLIRFKEGKMSTRKGNVIWMDDVLSEALTRAKKLGSETDELAKTVAIGALKYNDLKRDSKTDIVFDWDEILNMEGNSGPYLQYTVARCNSVIQKAPTFKGASFKGEYSNLNNEELLVLRSLGRFSEVIPTASKNYSPNILCNYLYDLAQKYNVFYNKHRILVDSEQSTEYGGVDGNGSRLTVHSSPTSEFRLLLTSATGQVLKNGLKLLGIQAPEKM